MPLLPSQTVVERLPIPLFESVVLAVRGEDTQIYVSLPDLCAALEITLAAQRPTHYRRRRATPRSLPHRRPRQPGSHGRLLAARRPEPVAAGRAAAQGTRGRP